MSSTKGERRRRLVTVVVMATAAQFAHDMVVVADITIGITTTITMNIAVAETGMVADIVTINIAVAETGMVADTMVAMATVMQNDGGDSGTVYISETITIVGSTRLTSRFLHVIKVSTSRFQHCL
jgi:hypothetical protein